MKIKSKYIYNGKVIQEKEKELNKTELGAIQVLEKDRNNIKFSKPCCGKID